MLLRCYQKGHQTLRVRTQQVREPDNLAMKKTVLNITVAFSDAFITDTRFTSISSEYSMYNCH